MDYKEEYERALGIAKMWYRNSAMPDNVREILCKIFPELKESEEGKIRTWLEEHIEAMPDNSVEFKDVKRIDVLHWLEKQGEQKTDEWEEGNIIRHGGILALVIEGRRAMKSNGEIFTVQYPDEWVKAVPNEIEHFFNEFEKQGEKPHGKSALEAIKEKPIDNANKVEPKFKVGQWIVWQDKCYKVNHNGCGYELIDQNDLSTSLEYGTIDENAHIWDITKDAKDGDVLANDHHVLILKELDYNWGDDGIPSAVKAYCGIKPNGNFEIGKDNWCFCGYLHIHPATKEQRDFLFAKMKEEGYKWNAEYKQITKL